MRKTKLKIIKLLIISMQALGPSFLVAQIGIMSISGDLTQGTLSSTEIQLVDLSGAGTGHDQISVSGNLSISGTLDIVLDGYTPMIADQFEIMNIGGTQTGSFSTINWPAGMTGWSIDYGVLNPGKVTIYGPNSTLPVELLHFSGEAMGDYNLLRWQTATEINNSRFDIEYSIDGISFHKVGEVSGQFNSNTVTDYEYKHNTIELSVHYYRLKQVDLDGHYTYSEIIAILRDEVTSIKVYPNPTTGILNFSVPLECVKVYNNEGKLMMDIPTTSAQVDLSHLNTGVYHISINGSKETITISKTK